MELGGLLAPLYAAALGGLLLAGMVWRRRGASGWPLALAAAAAVALVWLSSRTSLAPGWFSLRTLTTGVGFGLIALAALLAVVGTRLRRRAELILSCAPLPIDEAIRALRAGRGRGPGLFAGRLAASETVASPGGVVGAFYEAEVRALGLDGKRGVLLSRERGVAPVVWLRGERAKVRIEPSAGAVFGPVQVKSCPLGGLLHPASPKAFARGEPPQDALSFERVGRLGAACLVAGRLEAGPVEGSYWVKGGPGNPAVIVLGESGVAFGRAFALQAWASFAAAAALCMASAALLAAR